jgi:probable F420-dependent oxidoreductase
MKFWQSMAFLDTGQALDVARAVEQCGYDAVTVSDHLFHPETLRSHYPMSPTGEPFWGPETEWPDPWVLIGAMAAVTSTLRFTTGVYVAAARDLFTVAKLVSTAAVVSGGRVSLGVAAGWCREEFEQTGQDFASRGRRTAEMIPVLRELWGGGVIEHHGTYYDFEPLRISPVPDQPVPVYLGGESETALRRAATLADGWVGGAYTEDDADAILTRLRHHLDAAGRADEPFEVALALLATPDPDRYRRYADKGVTALLCAPWMRAKQPTLSARVAEIERFAETVLVKSPHG